MVNHLEDFNNESQEGHDKSRINGEGLDFRGLLLAITSL